MQHEYYQIAALLIAASIALFALTFILKAIFSFIANHPQLMVLLSLIAISAACIGLVVPVDPKTFECLTVISASTFILFYSAASYNHKRFGG